MHPSLYKQGDSYEIAAFFYLQEIPIQNKKYIYGSFYYISDTRNNSIDLKSEKDM
jgi:hypothetical protein